MQKGLSRRPIRWRCFPRQSCWTVSLKTATDVFLGQSGTWTISLFQCLSLIFCSMSSFGSLLKSCLIYCLTEWYGKSLGCVCKIRAPFLANESAASFPAIWQCPGIHWSTISLLLICCSCRILAWHSSTVVEVSLSGEPTDSIAAFELKVEDRILF